MMRRWVINNKKRKIKMNIKRNKIKILMRIKILINPLNYHQYNYKDRQITWQEFKKIQLEHLITNLFKDFLHHFTYYLFIMGYMEQ